MKAIATQKSYIESIKEDAEEMIFLLKQSSQEDKRELLGYMRGFFDGKESAEREKSIKEG